MTGLTLYIFCAVVLYTQVYFLQTAQYLVLTIVNISVRRSYSFRGHMQCAMQLINRKYYVVLYYTLRML